MRLLAGFEGTPLAYKYSCYVVVVVAGSCGLKAEKGGFINYNDDSTP